MECLVRSAPLTEERPTRHSYNHKLNTSASATRGHHPCNTPSIGPSPLTATRVSGYKSRGPRFDSWRCQIIRAVMGLEQGLFSPMKINEELLE
jgi:hypothetical protein